MKYLNGTYVGVNIATTLENAGMYQVNAFLILFITMHVIRLAAEEVGWERISCFGHTL